MSQLKYNGRKQIEYRKNSIIYVRRGVNCASRGTWSIDKLLNINRLNNLNYSKKRQIFDKNHYLLWVRAAAVNIAVLLNTNPFQPNDKCRLDV